jgi:AraC-like DNA-binding protein
LQLTPEIYQRLTAAKVFIDNHYHEALDLERISRQALLSKFHFHRLFTRVYRKTPHQYITRIRLEAAKVLLAREGISITEVCNEVGFESLGSFSTLFSRQSGNSPQYYRSAAWLKKKLADEQPKRFIPHCFIDQYSLGESSGQ